MVQSPPADRTREVEAIHRRLQHLRGSLFHGEPSHRDASGRLRRRAAALLAADPAGPDAGGLASAIELLDAQARCGLRQAG